VGFCELLPKSAGQKCKTTPFPLLSIPKLKGIPICCDRDVQVTSQIQITVQNGFFNAVIP
jgi:hypothetical protein